MLHRARDLLVRRADPVINAFGRIWPSSALWLRKDAKGPGTVEVLRARKIRAWRSCTGSLVGLAAELQAMQTMIGSIDKRIVAQHRSNEASRRLESIPGIGVNGAAAITATVPDPKVFRSGRDFAAWIGLVPRELDRRQAEAWADLETG